MSKGTEKGGLHILLARHPADAFMQRLLMSWTLTPRLFSLCAPVGLNRPPLAPLLRVGYLHCAVVDRRWSSAWIDVKRCHRCAFSSCFQPAFCLGATAGRLLAGLAAKLAEPVSLEVVRINLRIAMPEAGPRPSVKVWWGGP